MSDVKRQKMHITDTDDAFGANEYEGIVAILDNYTDDDIDELFACLCSHLGIDPLDHTYTLGDIA
jgi:hypothetical protein